VPDFKAWDPENVMATQQLMDTDEGTLPSGLRAFLRKRGYEFSGLLVLAVLGLVALSLATWSVDDPSLNNATNSAPQNVLGLPGAVIADQLMQLIGLGVLGLLAIPVAWAAKLLAHEKPAHIRLAVVAWLVATFALATALSALPRLSAWPMSVGMGGNIGDIFAGGLSAGLSLALKGMLSNVATATLAMGVLIWSAAKALGLSEIQTGPKLRRLGVFTATGAVYLWIGVKRLKSWRPAFPERRTVTRARLVDDDDDIIGRLAPVRAGSRKPMRFEPALDGARRRGPNLDFSGVEVGPDDDAGLDHGEIEIEDEPVPTKASRKANKPKAKSGSIEFELPPLELLAEPKRIAKPVELSVDMLQENARALEGVLDDFGVKGQIINVRPGPVVTLYELEPAPGIKSSRVISLADDIARSMSAISARVAVVPGRNAIGIELPNSKRETVYLRELLGSDHFTGSKMALAFALGKNIGGEPVLADLARMPHLLIAGTTGSGKSVGINTMILSLLYRMPPDRCKLIMIDPKMLELSVYEGIPHLLAPVVTDPRKAVVALKWAVREMEDRYKKMSKVGVRNVDGYNQRIEQLMAKGQKLTRTIQTGFDAETGQPIFEKEEMETSPMPFIVVIIDEMADLMMVAGKDIEGAVQRLAQMARAAGIHVVMATQRPSVDVITGTIKANFPTRISFQVTSKIDSRTILGEQGAEQLLGQGDMLHMAGGGRISRLHGAFVADGEVEAIVNHLKAQGTPEYVEAVTEEADDGEFGEPGSEGAAGGSGDELYDQAVAVVLRDKKVSTSYVQRRLQIGYNKAASLIERMEQEGLISASNATGKREILVPGDSARA
jgi:DNA segregation ATPase FtsK/SpoIIIE, S-DNA-T family